MKKTVHKKKSVSAKTGRNIIIAFVILVVILGAFFVVKNKKKMYKDHMNISSTIVGSTYLSLTPDKGCKTDETSGKYLCDIGIQNTSDETMSWAGHMAGMDGATLSSGGAGTINPQQSAVVQLSVPVGFCDTNKTGKVTFIDKSKSVNQGEVSFSCATQ